MRKFVLFLLLILSVNTHAEENNQYLLGRGDRLHIDVYNEPELTGDVEIDFDGNITLPLIGSFSINEKSISEVQELLFKKLNQDYLINPSIQVKIIKYRSFYIRGEVKKPGAYDFQPGLNIDKAIALAGGLTLEGSNSKVFISDIIDQKSLKNVGVEYRVSPDETITIEQSFF